MTVGYKGMFKRFCWAWVLVLCHILLGCAADQPSNSVSHSKAGTDVADISAADTSAEAGIVTFAPPVSWQKGEQNAPQFWRHFHFSGKTPTTYSNAVEDGRDAVFAQSTSSSSMLRRGVNITADQFHKINFAWKVPKPIAAANVGTPAVDDSPVRILLTFEGDRSKFSVKNAMVSELAHLLLGEPLPYATLVYVWSDHHPLESIITSPRTDRVRSIVVESGKQRLNTWLDYERDIKADYEKVFGETPGALLTAAIMTDSDNTQTQTSAWYGALRFTGQTK